MHEFGTENSHYWTSGEAPNQSHSCNRRGRYPSRVVALGHYMPSLSPTLMALREAARRFIRLEGCELVHAANFRPEAIEIIDAFAEFLPGRLNLPTSTSQPIEMIQVRDQRGELLAQIGGVEPNLEVAWTITNHVNGFTQWRQQIAELLAAGYPGCLGCGGPGSEESWDENTSRDLQHSIS